MSLSVIDKYVEKKKKDLLEYAKILESLITLEENKMWKNKSEFSNICKDVIAIYASSYYFDNNVNRDNPIEYSNDNINLVLQAIISYCKNNAQENLLRQEKNETFLLSVIVCTACYLDIATNVIDGNFIDTKNKFKYLLNYLKKTKLLKVYNNDRIRINELFDTIKKNCKEDSNFFKYYVSDNYHNEYRIYTADPLYYNFKFNYLIEDLNEYDQNMVEEIRNEFATKFMEISYELLGIHILKELISNKEMGTYLIPMNGILNKKPKLLKDFDNKYFKQYIKILVNVSEEGTYIDAINTIKEMGFKIIYEYLESENVNENKFTYDMEVIVNKEFIENNKENEYTWEKNNITFVIKNKED